MKKLFTLIILSIGLFQFSHAQWTEQNSGVTVQLTSVSYSNLYMGWICGYSGTVLRTTNNGYNWINVSGNGIPNTISLINIFSVDATVLTAGYNGTNTYVYRSSNSGTNWTQVFFQANGFINGICKLGNGNLFMQGDPVGGRWSLWKSTNSGVNWDSAGLYLVQQGSEAGWNNSLSTYFNYSKVWFGTNNYRIYYSPNNGTNWTFLSTVSEQNSYALWFGLPSAFSDGLCGGANLLRSTDSGSTWFPQSSIGTGNFSGFVGGGIIVENNLYIGDVFYTRSDNKIYSGNNGMNWSTSFTAPAGTYRYLGGGAYGGPFWAVRTNGGITYHPQLSGINPISSEIPESYLLHQNYPNPFNPSTAIGFDLPKSGNVKLVVYNSLGEEIAVLVSENLAAGSYEYKWTAGNLSSGVYFYTLEADNFRETKKMIIVK